MAAPGTAAARPPATMNIEANFDFVILVSLELKGSDKIAQSPVLIGRRNYRKKSDCEGTRPIPE